jgi:acetyl-CoA synthetase
MKPAAPKKTKLDGDVYYPLPEAVSQTFTPDWQASAAQADQDLSGYWAGRARELEWYRPWDSVLDETHKPFYQWFVGGQVNIIHNCLDRHVKTWRRNKLALIWEGEPGDQRSFSYHALNREVSKFANVLKAMGIKKGDRVTIYLPRIPEIVIAMLACAKIGAIHSVVYGGFSVEALHGRILDSHSKVAITADGGWLNGKIVKLKDILDEALQRSPSVEHVIVVKRTGQDVCMDTERDLWYHDLMALPIASPKCETEVMDAEDPLYILYTSGTTGKPKAILHTHGGYMVGVYATLHDVFDMRDEDRWWCTADPGWVTGHSYLV